MAKETKNLTTPLLIGVIVLLVGAVGYLLYYDEAEEAVGVEEEITEQEEVVIEEIAGMIKPPEGFVAEEMEVVSLWEPTSVEADGSFVATVEEREVTPVFAMFPDVDFAYVKISLGDSDTETNDISSNTTAVSMIFMNPLIMTSDPNQAEKYLTVIEAEPATKILAEKIEDALKAGLDPLEDDEVSAAYETTLENVLEKLANETQ